MYKIYGLHTPMFIKTVLAAEEVGAKYEVIPVDLIKGEHKTPEHTKKQPFGKVPALEHNGRFLFESNTIMRYIADCENSSFYPKNSYDRAVVDQWTDYFSLQVGRWCTNIWFTKVIGPKYFNEKTDDKLVADHTKWILEAMPIVDAHLAKNKWLAGANPTLADVNAFMLVRGFKDAGLSLGDFPNFMRWFNDYSQRPAVERIRKWM